MNINDLYIGAYVSFSIGTQSSAIHGGRVVSKGHDAARIMLPSKTTCVVKYGAIRDIDEVASRRDEIMDHIEEMVKV